MGSEALAYALRLLARKGYSRAVLRAKLAARVGEACEPRLVRVEHGAGEAEHRLVLPPAPTQGRVDPQQDAEEHPEHESAEGEPHSGGKRLRDETQHQ